MTYGGKGGAVATIAGAGAGAAILPVTGPSWVIPAATATIAVLVFWGVLYLIKNRTQ